MTDRPARRPRPAAVAASRRWMPPGRWASALAVRDGRIVAVGPDAAVAAHDRTVDARHRPSRPDRHARVPGRPRPSGPRRPGDAALRPPRRCRSRGPGSTSSRRTRESHPDEAWIRGGGWYMAAFEGGTPRREDLDRIVPDRPVFLTNRDGHGAWVNTQGARARRRDRRDPGSVRRADRARPGRHAERHAPRRRDGPGRPARCPTTRRPTSRRRSASASAHLHGFGITAWQDAIVEPHAEERAYVALASRGELTGRVVGRPVVGASPRRRADRGVRRAAARDGDRAVRSRRASS